MKGQIGNLTGFAYILMMLAIVTGVGLVVLSQFQTVGTPTQTTTVANTTNVNVPIAYGGQVNVYITFDQSASFGEFRQGQLTYTSLNSSATIPAENFTTKLNGVVFGRANGYNTSADWTYPLTASQMLNGKNNVSFILGNTTNISSVTLHFNYTRSQDLQARNTIGSTVDAFSTLVGWIPIIVVIVAVAIVLGLLGFGFSTGGKKQKR